MKVQMIGTGSITAKENPACVLIDDHILVDCGNGIVKALMKADVDLFNIDVLLITHLHGDHFADIPFLALPRSFMPVEKQMRVICPKNTLSALCELTKIIYSDVEPFEEIATRGKMIFEEFEDEAEFTADKYKIRSVRVNHGNFSPSFGFQISDGEKKLAVSGDSTDCEEIDKMLEEADLAILDCSFPETGEAHMGVDTIEEKAKSSKCPVIATHLSTNARNLLKEKEIKNVITPSDYDIINI